MAGPEARPTHDAEAARLRGDYPDLRQDPHPEVHGVLLSDEIELLADKCKLIDPFQRPNLKPAGYELTVGDEYILDGQKSTLAEGGSIEIPSFQVAILKTAETLNIPRFLIGRWNVRVNWAYRGLMWVGGPHVDPGWLGHLFCPIYNLSDKPVTITRGDPIAVMDFVKTTPFIEGSSQSYGRPPKRLVAGDYNHLKSAYNAEVVARLDEETTRVDEVRKEAEQLRGRVEGFVGIIFVILGLLIATLPLLTKSSSSLVVPSELIVYSSLGLSLGAVFLAMFNVGLPKWLRTSWGRTGFFVLAFAMLAVALTVGVELPRHTVSWQSNHEEEFNGFREHVESELKNLKASVDKLSKAPSSPSASEPPTKAPGR